MRTQHVSMAVPEAELTLANRPVRSVKSLKASAGKTQTGKISIQKDDEMDAMTPISTLRLAACQDLLAKAHAIHAAEGSSVAAFDQIKALLVDLALKSTLFPAQDFAMPQAQGRSHILHEEDNDGFGLYLTIGLPGKEAAPHNHGIWCINAAISGMEEHRFWRRTDDGAKPGFAMVEETGNVIVAPGTGMTMADQDIHSTRVLGDAPAFGLALYGYALSRFPSVVWYCPPLCSVRTTPSRRRGLPQRATTFKVTLGNTGQTIDCSSDQPILLAAVAAGIDYPFACATGNCGTCVSHLDSGEVCLMPHSDTSLTPGQIEAGQTLACRAQPRSDVAITWLVRSRPA